jgi:hypothetical protein
MTEPVQSSIRNVWCHGITVAWCRGINHGITVAWCRGINHGIAVRFSPCVTSFVMV